MANDIINISALAREGGVSGTTIRRWLADGKLPVPVEEPQVELLEPEPVQHVHRASTPWTSAVLVLLALVIGALALVINGQTGWRFGTTPLAAVTFAGLALAGDLLAIVLPATAGALWTIHRPLLAMLAPTTWTLCAALATLASLGFVELHTSDTAAGRAALVTASTTAVEQRTAAIAAAQTALATATRQREAECIRRGPFCRDREADERQ